MSQAYQLMDGLEPEVPIDKVAAAALADEDFHDVTIQSNDDTTLPANRTILALRSSVFRKMLKGRFSEAKSPVVEADYPGVIVKAIVDYIHTDDADILVEHELEATQGNEELLSNAKREEFQTLITLTSAAAYYNLPGLCHKANQCLSSDHLRFPSLSFHVLEAYVQQGPAISEETKEVALSNIRSKDLERLDASELRLLSHDALKEILGDQKNSTSNERFFALIRAWFEAESTDDRKYVATQLVAEHVELEWIRPTILFSRVASSGLVTSEQMLEAYSRQALKAESNNPMLFEKLLVSKPVWKKSGSHVIYSRDTGWRTSSLICPGLLGGGIYRWTVDISVDISANSGTWLGVASSSVADNSFGSLSQHCGHNAQCHGIYCNGYTYINGKKATLTLGEEAWFQADGSQVTLILDLSRGEGNNGSLSISVNGGPTVLAITNMRYNLKTGESYTPVVSVHGATATIVRIEEL